MNGILWVVERDSGFGKGWEMFNVGITRAIARKMAKQCRIWSLDSAKIRVVKYFNLD